MIRIDIQNDGTGDEHVGNYDVTVYLPGEKPIRTHVTNYRRFQGWVPLALAAVRNAAQKQKRLAK